MKTLDVESYLRELDRELRQRFVVDARILEETRGHLTDAIARAQAEGQSLDAARAQAITRFGAPEIVATAVAVDRTRLLYRLLPVAAIALGLGIAYVDARPGWDDAGVSAGAMLLAAAALSLMGPRKPWAWALGVGIWIPAWAFAHTRSVTALPMLLVLVFPFVGAYLGVAARRVGQAASLS